MNTQNDQDNAEDFETLYLAYRAKYEAAFMDAARYRFIREAGSNPARIEALNKANRDPQTPAEFDAAVDTAMLLMLD